MVVIRVYTYGGKISKKFRWESGFLWGGSMEPPLCTNGSAGYLMQLSVKFQCHFLVPWTILYKMHNFFFSKVVVEKVNFKSQILERPSIGKYWNILCVPVLSGNVIFTSFRTCWWHPEENNTGTPKWSSIVQYSCTSIWDLKYTFSVVVYYQIEQKTC